MTTPVEYELPPSIPTVRVTGEYRGPDGRGLSGTVTFTGPPLITFPLADIFVAGPVVARLDENGAFEVTLPATDAPNMNPADWSYTVKESLTGVSGSRTYSMILPADTPGGVVDLADIAPGDPTTPTYVPVVGPMGPQGPIGETGPQGIQGIDGSYWYISSVATPDTSDVVGQRVRDKFLYPQSGDIFEWDGDSWEYRGNIKGPKGDPGLGNVNSVNGFFGPDIVLTAADVSAIPTSQKGVANGIAPLNSFGNVPTANLPDQSDEYLAVGTRGAANGVASLNEWTKVPNEQLPEWIAYTPTWGCKTGAAPALGNGTMNARYVRNGNTIQLNITIAFGTTTTYGGGPWTFTLPVPVKSGNVGVGTVLARDTGVAYRGGVAYLTASVTERMWIDGAAEWSATVPFTWGSGDVFVLNARYETA